MPEKIIHPRLILFGFALFALCSCRKENTVDAANISSADSVKYNADWTFASHGNANQDYAMVFPQQTVNTIEITMTAAQWTSIKANVKTIVGTDFGVGGGGPPPATNATEPDYVDVTLKFNGKAWKNVGFRLKGNSTLRTAWQTGNYKLPFRLNFDEFEDKYPATTDQHFFGFEEMSFSPGAKDPSLIREKAASDIFRLAGIPCAQTAFYRVFIDFGSGLRYCGVYTGIELPDDHMIKQQFGEENGNIYKPESNLTSFNISLFEKKNNETTANYSDVQQLVTILNSPIRTTAAAQWRTQLEAVFNVNHFLRYLAINNGMVNWDSYGVMAHNFYLYNHSVVKLTWIPWDHNESLSGNPGITGTTGGGGPAGRSGLSLSMNEVAASWPLIRYLADDPVYMQTYKDRLKEFRNSVLLESSMHAMFDKYHGMISPFATGANGEQAGATYLTGGTTGFANALSDLKTHISNRRALIANYVP
jgi:spore coat protein CotH